MANARKYLDAWTVQDASNLSGIAFSFLNAMKEVMEVDLPLVRGSGFYVNVWIGHHPVFVLYTSKMMDLGKLWGSSVSLEEYHNAAEAVALIVKYPNSEVCPGCHQPIEAAVVTQKTCCCCENWPVIRRIA